MAPQGVNAFLEIEGGTKIPCQCNPEQLAVTLRNSWGTDRRVGHGPPQARFQGAESGTFDIGELFFDTTEEGKAVTKLTDPLLAMMDLDPSLPGYDRKRNNGRPPWVQFHWGQLHSFKSVVEDLTIRFTHFSSSGVPLRARVQLSLRQYQPDAKWNPQNPTSGTPRPHRLHRVQPGESLDRIAAGHYRNPTRWRAIAEANDIDDPLALRPGALLAIPELPA